MPASSLDRPNVICVRSFVPKLKKSVISAISSAVIAALGISIIVPTRYLISFPFSSNTFWISSFTSSITYFNSFTSLDKGIMISGTTSIPSSWQWIAACMIALACILEISGYLTPSLNPLKPSIGFTSSSSAILSLTLAGSILRSNAKSLISASPLGKNS